ncbi:citrate synthase [Aureobasidium subglaciale]|nr:citrate synthase [Aureobasidium subglaciale]
MSNGTLLVTDSRTNATIEIPITNNAVKATDFKVLKAPKTGAVLPGQAGAGLRLYDPGLNNTAVVESKICFSDGIRGIVQYRGQPIERLRDCEYEDLIHLFVWGSVPTPDQQATLKRQLNAHMLDIPPEVISVIQSFPADSTPFPMIMAGLSTYLGCDTSAIPTYVGGNIYHGDLEATDKAILRTLAAYAVCSGLAVSHRTGKEFCMPRADFGFLENLLLMAGIVDAKTGLPDPKHVNAVQRTWVLSAEHGPTNSTSALLLTASSLSDPISCLISAVSTAYGPLHFGATEVAYRDFEAVGEPANVPNLIASVKAGDRRLYGYGHRVYKTVDPRVLFAKQVLEDLNSDDNPLLQVAYEIDRVAATDDYFISRQLNANADLYGVCIYIALEYPPEIVPVMMFASRTAGLMAHFREAMTRRNQIWRPQQIYVGDYYPEEAAQPRL